MDTATLQKLHEATVAAGFGTNDSRVYALIDMANVVLAGHDLTPEHREQMKDFPNSLALLDWAAAQREKGLNRMHATPGPGATVETFAAEWLRSLSARGEVLRSPSN